MLEAIISALLVNGRIAMRCVTDQRNGVSACTPLTIMDRRLLTTIHKPDAVKIVTLQFIVSPSIDCCETIECVPVGTQPPS